MKNNLQMEINKLSSFYEKSFINDYNELILLPKLNEFFNLEKVETVLDLKCKLIEFTVRSTCKGVSDYWQRYLSKRFNGYLGTNFNKKELLEIYTELGNGVNRELCIKFIKSNYDINVLKR